MAALPAGRGQPVFGHQLGAICCTNIGIIFMMTRTSFAPRPAEVAKLDSQVMTAETDLARLAQSGGARNWKETDSSIYWSYEMKDKQNLADE